MHFSSNYSDEYIISSLITEILNFNLYLFIILLSSIVDSSFDWIVKNLGKDFIVSKSDGSLFNKLTD